MQEVKNKEQAYFKTGLLFALLAPVVAPGGWFFIGLITFLIYLALLGGPDTPKMMPAFGIFGQGLVLIPYLFSVFWFIFFSALPIYCFTKTEKSVQYILIYLVYALVVSWIGYGLYHFYNPTLYTVTSQQQLPESVLGKWRVDFEDPYFQKSGMIFQFIDDRHATITIIDSGEVYRTSYEIRTFKPITGLSDTYIFFKQEDPKFRYVDPHKHIILNGFSFKFVSSHELEVWVSGLKNGHHYRLMKLS